MIFGLGAALGWGFADLMAALSGRRIGPLATLVITQLTTGAIMTVLLLATGQHASRLVPLLGWLLPNAVVTAAAYYSLYRALSLGPVAVVSPMLACYGVVPVLLSVALLGEHLATLTAVGAGITIAGAMLASTDLRAVGRVRGRAAGLPWALAATGLFGVATYVFGWSAKRVGWLPAIWFSRVTIGVIFVAAALVWRSREARAGDALAPIPSSRAIAFAIGLGIFDLLGSISYSRGAELGFISIVTAASATYPVVPVLGGVIHLRERPAPNQYVGIGLVIAGLLAVGFG